MHLRLLFWRNYPAWAGRRPLASLDRRPISGGKTKTHDRGSIVNRNIPWRRLEKLGVALVILHSLLVGALLIFFTGWTLEFAGFGGSAARCGHRSSTS